MAAITEHEAFMREAIAEGELARGRTGDNPWVGCVIVVGSAIVSRGRTQGPGEDHAEVGALRDARAAGVALERAVLYSTLEPCSFHGRTPSCARVIAESGIPLVVTGMRDPHPRVDGEGARMVRQAGVEVIEGICEAEVRRQLAPWVLREHSHEALGRARDLARAGGDVVAGLAAIYGVDRSTAEELARRAAGGFGLIPSRGERLAGRGLCPSLRPSARGPRATGSPRRWP
jgi:diaminohydroxyphosphoribosylaminopyrimidine deaminase / 5-amino-6-(5-phosphoribosylamino)uracil reductase